MKIYRPLQNQAKYKEKNGPVISKALCLNLLMLFYFKNIHRENRNHIGNLQGILFCDRSGNHVHCFQNVC